MDELTNLAAPADHIEQLRHDPAQLPEQIDVLFDRHLQLDNVVDPTVADARQRFEAAARAVRDVLSQRWIKTQRTYDKENPKRVYYGPCRG
jgi:glycogen phosphorylase